MRQKLDLRGQVRSWSGSITIRFFLPHTRLRLQQPAKPAWRLFRVSGGKRDKQLITLWVSLGSQTKTDRCHLVISPCKSQTRSTGSWLAQTCCRIYPLTYGTCQAHWRIERSRCSEDTGRPKISSAVMQNCRQYGTHSWHLDVIIIYLRLWGLFLACFGIFNGLIAAVIQISALVNPSKA